MGRPKLDPSEVRDARVILRVRVVERERWARTAARAGLTLSEWLRSLANGAAPAPKRGAK